MTWESAVRFRKQKNPHNGGVQEPMFLPHSAWTSPVELPDLRQCKHIALDRETKDEGLARGRGPGWAYKAGFVVGNAVAWPGGSFYAPLRHPDTANIDAQAWQRWERDHIAAGVRFIFQNAPYDLGWGRAEWDMPCPQKIEDTTAMAVMVDENRLSYKLDDLCSWRGLPGKEESMLNEAASAYGYGGDVKSNLWRFPARFVGPYGERDAISTLQVFESLLPELQIQDLQNAYRLEMDLVPMVQEMRWRGIRIDLDQAEIIKANLLIERDRVLADLSERLGHRVGMEEMRSAQKLAPFFDAQKLIYPRTAKSDQASFEKDWMEGNLHWLPQGVVAARSADDSANKFMGEYIQGYAHRGRIHASINQWRSDEGGTRSHRFSYSDPPVQQLHELIRGVFIPEEDHLWLKADYSQQEMRLIVHFAALLGCAKAGEAAERYRSDPNTDFHDLVADLTGLERYDAKQVNFAKAFGAGVKKFALMTGRNEEDARDTMGQYDREMPFVKQLSERFRQAADSRGYIRLIDGARCHFDLWEASRWDANRDGSGRYMPPRSLEAAREAWPNQPLRRAFTHKAMNRGVQGGGARQMKHAMRDCWREGLVPLLQLHDELDFSFGEEAQGARVTELMRDTWKFEVPFFADASWGTNWGNARKVKGGYGATWEEACAL